MWQRRGAGSLFGHATDRDSLSRRGRLRRRGRRPGLGSGPARRHRRACLHELHPEHSVVRMAGDRRGGRLPDPLRLLREQHAEDLTGRQRVQRQLRLELGQLERRGHAPARRSVRRLRPGPLLAPERLAVLPRRTELVLDGHHRSAGVRTRRSTARSRPRPSNSRPVRPSSRTRRSRCGSTSPTTSPARSRPTSSASRSVPDPTTCATRTPARSSATTRLLGPGRRRQVDHVHLHRRLRRDPGRQRVGLRERGRRLDPGQPVRLQPERHGRQGEPVRCELRRRGRRPHGADGRDRRGLHLGQGRRPGVAAGHGLGRHVGPRGRRPVDVGRQHRRRER